MRENELAKIVVNICYNIHVKTGPGLLEDTYEEILCSELEELGIAFKRQYYFPLKWKGRTLNKAFRVDILVEDLVVLELKSVLEIRKVDFVRLKTYLKLLDKRLGLMINFNVPLMKEGITRVANNLY